MVFHHIASSHNITKLGNVRLHYEIIVLAAQPEGVMFAVEAKYDLELIMILLSET